MIRFDAEQSSFVKGLIWPLNMEDNFVLYIVYPSTVQGIKTHHLKFFQKSKRIDTKPQILYSTEKKKEKKRKKTVLKIIINRDEPMILQQKQKQFPKQKQFARTVSCSDAEHSKI